jgi:hypothetical protein
MARPKKYADEAAKQRAYRRRKYLDTLTPEESAFQRAQHAHQGFQFWANQGDELAAKLLGRSCFETALNVLAHLGTYALSHAHEHEIVPVNEPNWFGVKSE